MDLANLDILDYSFYDRDTIQVANDILGCILVNKTNNGITTGKIVEVEAYITGDPGSHSYNGKTYRNRVMFGPPGHAYVYFIYGMYHCFNVVTREVGIGEAILFRALEPLDGIDIMKKRRKTLDRHNLCSGPAKLVQAMGIDSIYNGIDITRGDFFIYKPKNKEIKEIVKTIRIGLNKGAELPYRFYIKGNNFVSKK